MKPSKLFNLSLAGLLACAAGGAALAAPADGVEILHKEQSLYRNIYVFEKGDVRCMRFTKYFRTGDSQSCMYKADPNRLFYDYAKVVMSTLYLNPDPQRILITGLGGGTLPAALARLLPQAEIDVVEIDPAVSRVAKAYFPFETSERVRVHDVDGRVFVKRAARSGKKYDLVILDAFNGDYIPEHMLTREYLEEVKSVIADGGVLAANTFSDSQLYHSESVTYAEVFGDFINVKVGNRLIIWQHGGLPSDERIAEGAKGFEEAFEPLGFGAHWVLPRLSREQDWQTDAPLLTDQYSPSNLLNAR